MQKITAPRNVVWWDTTRREKLSTMYQREDPLLLNGTQHDDGSGPHGSQREVRGKDQDTIFNLQASVMNSYVVSIFKSYIAS